MALDIGSQQTRWKTISSIVTAQRSGFERYQWSLRLVVAMLDTLVIVAAVLLAVELRGRLDIFPEALDVESNVQRIAAWLVVVWVAVLWGVRSYSERSMGAGTREYHRVLLGSFTTAGLVGIVTFLTDYPLSRGFYVLAFTIGTTTLLVERFVLRRVIHRLRLHDHLIHRVILSGAPGNVDAIARILGRERWLGFRVIGATVPQEHLAQDTPHGVPILGSTANLIDAVARTEPSAVIFVGGSTASPAEVRRGVWELEERGIGTFMVPSLTDVAEGRLTMIPMGGLPLVHVAPPQSAARSRFPKRVFDVVGSVLLLLVTAPLMAAVTMVVKAHDGGPVIFRQTRVGKDGATFRCLKIRTMVPDAEGLEAEMRRKYSDPGAVLFKMTQDPRITGPGRFLRRYSIDELPQLWNVLKGDMSLVGPRPALPLEVALYTDDEQRRLRVRPGLSGLWQVSGRSNLSREDALRLDLYYVDNWSLMQDVSILFRTAKAVLQATGAY